MQTTTVPEGLRLFKFHGLELRGDLSREEVLSDCPFCDRQGKFAINKKTTKWNCLSASCGLKGNNYEFVRTLYQEASKLKQDYRDLSKNRGLEPDTLKTWGVVRSPINGAWLIPGYNYDKKLVQLYKYARTDKGMAVIPGPGLSGLVMFGSQLYNEKKPMVYLCEGYWDGLRLYEVLRNHREMDGQYIEDRKGNLLRNANVLAVPGCGSFKDTWSYAFRGKMVYIVFDNDHPKNGKPSSAYSGLKRTVGILQGSRYQPNSIEYFKWGDKGYDKRLPHGYDLRDYMKGKQLNGRLEKYFNSFEPIPDDWVDSDNKKSAKKDKIFPVKCEKWLIVKNAWRRALKWSDGLDVALSVMLASLASVEVVGDPIWFKILGPPSSAKSTLCEAVTVNKKYVIAKSKIKGFYSGYQTDKHGKNDYSLVSKLYGMGLVTKDGDTLLQESDLPNILGEARDLFDGVSRSSYKNKMSKEYEGLRFVWILCGTSSLRLIDESELGQRFLDCVIMETIERSAEREVQMSIIEREDINSSLPEGSSIQDPNQVKAFQLTAGYVSFLRENIHRLMTGKRLSRGTYEKILNWASFIAHLRARPSKKQDEEVTREFSGRLSSQLTKLTKCLGVVMNRQQLDDPEVLRRVRKVVLDSSRGNTLKIVNYVYGRGYEGAETRAVGLEIGLTETKVRALLNFLKRIDVLRQVTVKVKGLNKRPKWKLNSEFERIYKFVMEEE